MAEYNITTSPILIEPRELIINSDQAKSETVKKHFKIINNTNSSIVVDFIQPSCSCTLISDYSHTTIPPKGFLSVSFDFDLPKFGTSTSYIQAAIVGHAKKYEFKIQAKGTEKLPLLLTTTGSQLGFFDITKETPPQLINVTTREDVTSKTDYIKAFSCTIPEVSCRVISTRRSTSNSYVDKTYTVEVKWNGLPKQQNFVGKVLAIVNGPGNPLQVSSITGNVQN